MGTRPAFCAGSCPAAQASGGSLSHIPEAKRPALSARQPGQVQRVVKRPSDWAVSFGSRCLPHVHAFVILAGDLVHCTVVCVESCSLMCSDGAIVQSGYF